MPMTIICIFQNDNADLNTVQCRAERDTCQLPVAACLGKHYCSMTNCVPPNRPIKDKRWSKSDGNHTANRIMTHGNYNLPIQ